MPTAAIPTEYKPLRRRRELATAPAWVLSRGIEMAKTENRKRIPKGEMAKTENRNRKGHLQISGSDLKSSGSGADWGGGGCF